MRRVRLILFLAQIALLSSAVASTALPPPDASTALPPPEASRFVPSPARAYGKVTGDSVEGHRLLRLKEAGSNGHYEYPIEPVMERDIEILPVPEKLILSPKKLSLNEAIVLALRNNPAVKISEMQRILDKFGLELAIHNYAVVWNPLTFSSTIQNRANPTWSATSGFGITTSSGTNFTLAHTNNLLGGLGSTALTMTQPLLQNFGFEFNRIPYQNALDSEKVARLTFKNSVITVVVGVITDYRALVQQYNSLDEDKKSLASQEKQVVNDQLQVKVGQMAPSDLLQQQTNVESTRLSVVQAEQTLRNAYFTFLSQLGLIPSTRLTIDRNISVSGERVPTLEHCIQLALEHNIAYRSALLQLNVTKRALITANNARKWTLNMVTSVTETGQRSAVGQPIVDTSTNPSVAFNLSIPIDNISLKQAVVSAKIGIEGAKLNLEQQKENLVRQIMNQWASIHNQYEQILVAEKALQMQEKTLQNAKLKMKYGRSSMFEVNTLETNLLTQQVNLISTKISYLNAITSLYQTMGLTLEKWHIKLRY